MSESPPQNSKKNVSNMATLQEMGALLRTCSLTGLLRKMDKIFILKKLKLPDLLGKKRNQRYSENVMFLFSM